MTSKVPRIFSTALKIISLPSAAVRPADMLMYACNSLQCSLFYCVYVFIVCLFSPNCSFVHDQLYI